MKLNKYRVSIDNVSVTHEPLNHIQEDITKKIKNILSIMGYKCSDFKGYRYGIDIPLSGNESPTLRILAHPNRKKNAFLKIDFNPAKVDKEGLISIRQWLDYILGKNYSIFYQDGIVTLIDVAVDFKGIVPTEVLINISAKNKTMMYFDSNKLHRTEYFGCKDRDQIIIYDKGLEKFGKDNEVKLTRIEFSQKQRIKLESLQELNISFKGVEIYNLSVIDKNKRIPQCFMYTCLYLGLKPALCLLEPHEEEVFKHLLASSKIKLPSDKVIHKKYLKCLSRLDCLNPENTYPSVIELHPELSSGSLDDSLDEYLSDLGDDD